MHHLKLILQVF